MAKLANEGGKTNGHATNGPPVLTLPFADFSHALVRAHHDAHAMAAANRALANTLRDVLRRQQDLAFELAEAAIGATVSGRIANQAAVFDRAAKAVREVGEAIIDAQIEALRMLQTEAEPERAAFAFPPMIKDEGLAEEPAPAEKSVTQRS